MLEITHVGLRVKGDKVSPLMSAHCRALVELWHGADLEFLVSESIATFNARFDHGSWWALVFFPNEIHAATIGWNERII